MNRPQQTRTRNEVAYLTGHSAWFLGTAFACGGSVVGLPWALIKRARKHQVESEVSSHHLNQPPPTSSIERGYKGVPPAGSKAGLKVHNVEHVLAQTSRYAVRSFTVGSLVGVALAAARLQNQSDAAVQDRVQRLAGNMLVEDWNFYTKNGALAGGVSGLVFPWLFAPHLDNNRIIAAGRGAFFGAGLGLIAMAGAHLIRSNE